MHLRAWDDRGNGVANLPMDTARPPRCRRNPRSRHLVRENQNPPPESSPYLPATPTAASFERWGRFAARSLSIREKSWPMMLPTSVSWSTSASGFRHPAHWEMRARPRSRGPQSETKEESDRPDSSRESALRHDKDRSNACPQLA